MQTLDSISYLMHSCILDHAQGHTTHCHCHSVPHLLTPKALSLHLGPHLSALHLPLSSLQTTLQQTHVGHMCGEAVGSQW